MFFLQDIATVCANTCTGYAVISLDQTLINIVPGISKFYSFIT